MALMSSLQAGLVQRSSWMEPYFYKSSQRGHAQHGIRLNGGVPVSWLCNQDLWCVHLWSSLRNAPRHVSGKASVVASASNGAVALPSDELVRVCAVAFKNVMAGLNAHPVLSSCAPPLALVLFAIYGLVPCAKLIQQSVSKKMKWDSSPVKQIVLAYARPVLLWMGIVSVCRVVDPIVLSTVASQAIKDRAVNFVRSLSTVLAFSVCTTNFTQQVQKSMENPDSERGKNLGIQFISNAVCTSVWVAAICLFMELLGFSTQKWITAGGLGTVLVTLAGREIFTNFLSSVMIHATRPFIENQWIQTKIEGQEVSGTVEHVGWWSPTVIRGDDREAVHIPNHKFTVSVVRNLSQKTHWRIKTHLAISHLDAGKIAYVVADMRKVLAKHGQVEHKRLHRRVFLDFIHPENQALHILVSCFVKTSRFEEYLRVKESILLDLLRVISHHNARLATPIRSVQRAQVDDSHQNSSQKYDRTYLISENSVVLDVNHPGERHSSKSKSQENRAKAPGENTDSPKLEGLDSMGLNSKDITLLGAAFGKPLVEVTDGAPAASSDRQENVPVPDEDDTPSHVKRGKIYVQDDVKEQIVDSIRGNTGEKSKRPPLVQENMVLGVALDGSKRTLPLESPDRTEAQQQQNVQQLPAADARERER